MLLAATLACAAALAGEAFRTGLRDLWFDAGHYHQLARAISQEGFWSLHNRFRTYGYPLFICLCTGFSDAGPALTHALVFAAQLALYLSACVFAARVAERIFGASRFFAATLLVMALNPIALIHTTEVLTDLLSAVLLLIALLVSLERGHTLQRIFIAALCLGLAIVVRPANLSVLPAFALLWALKARLYRGIPIRAILIAVASLALPFLPQLYSNVKAYRVWSPLLADRLYGAQVEWGMSMAKYGTIAIRHVGPRLVYENPFLPPGSTSVRQVLQSRPLEYLATLGVHGFALIDQDFPFTYITDLSPWYRWPLSAANYAFFSLAALGLALGLKRGWRGETGPTLYFTGAALVSLSYVALYLPVAVENRFSLPLYLILSPAAVFGGFWIRDGGPRRRIAAAAVGLVVVGLCAAVSLWLSAQAPLLVRLTARGFDIQLPP